MAVTIQTRRDEAADWTAANPVLALGEIGIETDTGKAKYGDGFTLWNSLDYFIDAGALAIPGTNGQTLRYKASTSEWVANSSLVVLDNGNVGIGTTVPTAPVAVAGLNEPTTGGATAEGTLQIAEFGATNLNSFQSGLEFWGDGSGAGYGSKILGDNGGALLFGNRVNSATFTERLRIDNLGSLLVGKSADIIAGNGHTFRPNGISLHTISTVDLTHIVYDVDEVPRFYVSGLGQISATQTTITAISDATLKENIVDCDYGLEAVLQLQPRKYDWIDDAMPKGNYGFVAQEVAEVIPEFVTTMKHKDDEEKLALKADLFPVLVKAIQEQQEIIDDLRQRVAQLEIS